MSDQKFNIRQCPLTTHYIENVYPETASALSMLNEFRKAAEGGEADAIYQYGLQIYQLLLDEFEDDDDSQNVFGDLPSEVWDDAIKLSYEMFYQAARGKHPEGMLWVAWCKFMSIGTEENLYQAKMWFDAAKDLVGDEVYMRQIVEKELEGVEKSPLYKKPTFN
ncbi:MAG: hypothetical protein VXY16_06905 [Pseudomonadota bacterium]|nr:hypothetical protein [Pseudomonadota bacterium]